MKKIPETRITELYKQLCAIEPEELEKEFLLMRREHPFLYSFTHEFSRQLSSGYGKYYCFLYLHLFTQCYKTVCRSIPEINREHIPLINELFGCINTEEEYKYDQAHTTHPEMMEEVYQNHLLVFMAVEIRNSPPHLTSKAFTDDEAIGVYTHFWTIIHLIDLELRKAQHLWI